MQPELSCGESVCQEKSSQGQVDQVGEDRSQQEKAKVHFGVPEDPSEQPKRGPEVPKKHGSGDEDAKAMDAPGHLAIERLGLLGR